MTGWTVIVPIKPWALAKSRFEGHPQRREQLARALSLDTLDTVMGAESVGNLVVVSAQPEAGAAARGFGGSVVMDRPLVTSDGLNAAVRLGVRWATIHYPKSPVVVVPSDLASLTSSVLDVALDLLGGHPSGFVPDAAGTGTTLLSAADPSQLAPHYGHASSAWHSRAGATAQPGVDGRVRLDVDTVADLAVALQLGVGSRTAAIAEVMLRSRVRRWSEAATLISAATTRT
jgi:2-phospho-L-lactate guanylyltransferase